MCLEDVVHVFMQSIIDLTLSLGSGSHCAQRPHTSLCFNVNSAMSSYASPRSPNMTKTSSAKDKEITVMQHCSETWDQSRDWHHLGIIDFGSVIVGIGILISMHFQHLTGNSHLFFLSFLLNCHCRMQFYLKWRHCLVYLFIKIYCN